MVGERGRPWSGGRRLPRWGAPAAGAAVLCALVGALPAACGAAAAASSSASLPAVTIGLGSASTPGQVTTSLQILLLLTLLALAPAALLLMTSFTRIVVVLSFARTALGSGNLPPNQVLIGLALFLTLFVMAPTIGQIYTTAYQPYAAGSISLSAALQRAEDPLRSFMQRQTSPEDLAMFEQMRKQGQAAASGTGAGSAPSSAPTAAAPSAGAAGPPVPAAAPSAPASSGTAPAASSAAASPPPLVVLVPAFVISELRVAFEMGFLLYVPFVIIDLVVASTLMAMGMVMLPPLLISLPFKILLFVLVDGWTLLAQSLVTSFH